jgi:hypothetical protein
VSGEELIREALALDQQAFDVNRLVLAHGTAYVPIERPADVPPGERHDSFRNAFRLASSRPDLAYCEGFSLPRGYTERPNRHGWCADEHGHAIDPTPGWTDPGRPLRDCYLGLAIPLDFAAPIVDREDKSLGVLFELTGRMGELAARLGVEPV